MKLRIQGNSVRFRLLRSEVTTFIETGRIEHTVHFAPDARAFFQYGLQHQPGLAQLEVRPDPSGITVAIPGRQARTWAETDQIGIYATIDLGSTRSLEISVEKDFACLDLSDAENQDAFPNPQIGAVC